MNRIYLTIVVILFSLPMSSQVNITTFAGGMYLGQSKQEIMEKWRGKYEENKNGNLFFFRFDFLGLKQATLSFNQDRLVRAEFYTNEGDFKPMTHSEAMNFYKRCEKINVSRCENLYRTISSKYGEATILENNRRAWIDSYHNSKLSIEYSYRFNEQFPSIHGTYYEVMTTASIIYEFYNSSNSHYDF